MNQLINNIFEKLCEPVRAEEVATIAKLTNDAASKGVLYNGVYFGRVYEAREKALRLVTIALIDAYKQAAPIPTEAIIAEAKEQIEAVVDAEIARILVITRNSFRQLVDSSGLQSELVSKSEAARRSVLKNAFREIDIWAGLHQKRETNKHDDVIPKENNIFEDEILRRTFNNANVQPIHILSADQILGEWIRIGNEDFLRKNNSIFHHQYRDALDRLIAKGHVKWESGKLYRLTADGISAAQSITSKQNINGAQAGNLQSESANENISKYLLSWKNPLVRHIYVPIFVTVASALIVYYLTGGGKPANTQTFHSNYGDTVGGDKISGQNITVNKYERVATVPMSGAPVINTSKAKLKINRAVDDYLNAIKALKSSYAEDSGKITSDAASRGIYDSGIHVGSHIKLAVKIKQSLDKEKRNLDRKIEDILMENLNNTSLASSGAGFNPEKGRLIEAQKAYDELCVYLNKSTKDKEFKILGEVMMAKDFDVAKY